MDIETEAVLIRQAKMANARLHNLQQILSTNDGVRKDAMLEALDTTDPMNREIRKPQGLRRHTQACPSTFLSNSPASVQPLQSPEPHKHRLSITKKCREQMQGSENYKLREHSPLTASRIFNDSVPSDERGSGTTVRSTYSSPFRSTIERAVATSSSSVTGSKPKTWLGIMLPSFSGHFHKDSSHHRSSDKIWVPQAPYYLLQYETQQNYLTGSKSAYKYIKPHHTNICRIPS